MYNAQDWLNSLDDLDYLYLDHEALCAVYVQMWVGEHEHLLNRLTREARESAVKRFKKTLHYQGVSIRIAGRCLRSSILRALYLI